MDLLSEIPKSWKQWRAKAKGREKSNLLACPLPCLGTRQLVASHSTTVLL